MESVKRQARGTAATSWQWAGTAARRRALLEAGHEVFAEVGFAAASITEIARRSGSSAGSLYHHIGGKAELFIALWEEHYSLHEEAVSLALTEAQQQRVSEPLDLFIVCVKASLEDSWQRRDLAMLFQQEDSIPGFSAMKRRSDQEWIVRCDTLLGVSESALDRIYTGILTAVIDEGAREVASAGDRHHANMIISATIDYLQRIMVDDAPRRTVAVRPVS